KLILGVYDNFAEIDPDQTSWRFHDRSMPDLGLADPWTISEGKIIEGVETSQQVNFSGIKIGDVDGSVVSTLSGQQLHSRFGQRKFVVANSVDYKAGEKVNISLNLDMLAASVGFQFTVKLKEGVDIISVLSESDKLSTDNFGLTKLENGLIAISWHSFDGNEFGVNNRIVIEAITDHEGVVSDALLINSDVVESEAYGADGKVHAVGVKFAYDEN